MPPELTVHAASGAAANARRTPAGWPVPLALATITGLAFLPVIWNGFVAWDDARLLSHNPDYRGLGWTQLRWMFTTVLLGHYTPLTWLSFGLDYVLWGTNPLGYHLTNLGLHAVAVVLFYQVARLLLARGTAFSLSAVTLGAATAALFFGIHPLRVESVAWATERRDVLSGMLLLLTVWLYLRATEAAGSRRRARLALAVIGYLLALASKSVVMTLPLVLLLLDLYPLRRLSANPREWFRSGRSVLWEKVPFGILALAGAGMAYLAQVVLSGPLTPYGHSPWLSRAANVAYTLWFHVLKTVLPAALSPLYEAPPRIDPVDPRFLASAAGVVAVTALVLLLRSRCPAALAAWTYHVIVLAPVSGVLPLGYQLTADRYSYLPSLGWAMLVGGGAGAILEAARRGAVRRPLARLAAGVGAAALIGLGCLTWQQVRIWHDTESLWRRAVAVDPDCVFCHKYLAEALMARGAPLSALEHFETAAALRPDDVGLRVGVAAAFTRLGMWPEAVGEYRRVLATRPRRVDVRNVLGATLHAMGRPQEAVEELRTAMRIAPDNADVRVTLGFVLMDLGEPDEAAEHLRRASERSPNLALARVGLVQAYAAAGRRDLAREQYEALSRLDPRAAATVDPRWVGKD
jgi:tetratricopeptide (TPR) repeat protein